MNDAEQTRRARAAEADDVRWMGSIVQGDARALELLYDRHGAVVFALCLRMLRNAAQAEDLMQEIFWEVWRRADRFDASRGSARAYLMSIARSRALDRLRRRRRRDELALRFALETGASAVEVEGIAGPEDAASDAEQRHVIARALSCLPQPQRRAVMLAFFDGLTHREIAAELEVPLGTIKTRIRKGLFRLRDQLVQLYDGQDEREG